MSRKVILRKDYDHRKKHKASFDQKDKVTVPDMTLSLAKLVERHRRGQEVEHMNPVYMGDVAVDLRYLDRLERADLIRETIEHVNLRKQEILDARKAREAFEEEQEVLEEPVDDEA